MLFRSDVSSQALMKGPAIREMSCELQVVAINSVPQRSKWRLLSDMRRVSSSAMPQRRLSHRRRRGTPRTEASHSRQEKKATAMPSVEAIEHGSLSAQIKAGIQAQPALC